MALANGCFRVLSLAFAPAALFACSPSQRFMETHLLRRSHGTWLERRQTDLWEITLYLKCEFCTLPRGFQTTSAWQIGRLHIPTWS